MDASALKLCLDCSHTGFSFAQRAGDLDASELTIGTVLQSRKRENRIEFLPSTLKLLASAHEPGRRQEGPYEVDYLIGATMLLLRLQKDGVQATPLR
jgi:hypothetical protein